MPFFMIFFDCIVYLLRTYFTRLSKWIWWYFWLLDDAPPHRNFCGTGKLRFCALSLNPACSQPTFFLCFLDRASFFCFFWPCEPEKNSLCLCVVAKLYLLVLFLPLLWFFRFFSLLIMSPLFSKSPDARVAGSPRF